MPWGGSTWHTDLGSDAGNWRLCVWLTPCSDQAEMLLARVRQSKMPRRFSLLLLACVEVTGCGGMSSGAPVEARDASGVGASIRQNPWSEAGNAAPQVGRDDSGDSANAKGNGEAGDGGDSASDQGDGEAGDGGAEASIPLCDVAHGVCVTGTNLTYTRAQCGAAGSGGVQPGAELCWILDGMKGLPFCRLPACDLSRQGQGCGVFEGDVTCIDGEWRSCGLGPALGVSCPGNAPNHVPSLKPSEGAVCCPNDFGSVFAGPTGCCIDARFAECVSHHVRYTPNPQCETRDAGNAAPPDAFEEARADAMPDVLTNE
jgi:hypothetical protein